MESLLQIAKEYESVIMEQRTAEGWNFLLWDDGMLLRFVLADPDGSAPAP
jgi:hypothetical protein